MLFVIKGYKGNKRLLQKASLSCLGTVFGPLPLLTAQQPLKARHGYVQSLDAAALDKNKEDGLRAPTTNKQQPKPQLHTVKYQNTTCSTENSTADGGITPQR